MTTSASGTAAKHEGREAAEKLGAWQAEMAVVLGSGLSALVEQCDVVDRVRYDECPGLPRPSVAGHGGEFHLVTMEGRRLILACGRCHLYEGRSAREATAGVRFLAEAGVRRLILTNAAGIVNETFRPGDWMTITDHLNLTGVSPLEGEGGFVDMSEAYSPRLRSAFAAAAQKAGIDLAEGVYAAVRGPQYETPAEVRMLRQLGADAVGMSTVLETIQARALGIEVAGFSCLTNFAAGIRAEHLSHDHVLAAGRRASDAFLRLLREFCCGAAA